MCTESENRRRAQGAVCLCDQVIFLTESRLGLYKFISYYLLYFEEKKNIFQYQNKKRLN
jgi:hypothetical protein